MHEIDFLVHRVMRMGILGSDSSVCRPASVSDAHKCFCFFLNMGKKMTDFSYFTYKTDIILIINSDKSCRVVSAIFEIFEPLIEMSFWRFFPNISDDSAHSKVVR